MVETTDTRIFKIVALAIAFVMLALAIINIVYFVRAFNATNNNSSPNIAITRNEMIILVSSNVLLAALALVVIIWVLISLISALVIISSSSGGYIEPKTNFGLEPDLSYY